MTAIRPAAVAGFFYPGKADELKNTLARMLAAADVPPDAPAPKALIVPHAGYIYSGACAAQAYARLTPMAGRITRVVLLGPCHRVAVRGLATTSASQWQSPLGPVEIDRAALDQLSHLPHVGESDAAHAQEHSLEVHLPFLQKMLGDGFKLVPFAVGQASNTEVAQVLEALWGGPETLIVISTDLSHFLTYDEAHALDSRTAEAIEAYDWQSIGRDQACGRIPMSGLLTCAPAHGLEITRVGFCNSGDTAGDRNRVVGYGAWVLQ